MKGSDVLKYNNMAKLKAIEAKNKKKLLDVNNSLDEKSGIYFLIRVDENNIKYAYIGQAKHILTRLAQHLVGYQHIDLSLKKHGFKSLENPYGWKIDFLVFPELKLDEMEDYYIKTYAQKGYQLRNKKLGGQCSGNDKIDEYRPAKGYRDGIKQGYKNASKEISLLFEKHLNFSTKSENPNVNQQKAIKKFEDFLNFYKSEKSEESES
jgi:hypothetical protein